MHLRVVPTPVTLNGVMDAILRYLAEIGSFMIWLKLDPCCPYDKEKIKEYSFRPGNIRFMAMFLLRKHAWKTGSRYHTR